MTAAASTSNEPNPVELLQPINFKENARRVTHKVVAGKHTRRIARVALNLRLPLITSQFITCSQSLPRFAMSLVLDHDGISS